MQEPVLKPDPAHEKATYLIATSVAAVKRKRVIAKLTWFQAISWGVLLVGLSAFLAISSGHTGIPLAFTALSFALVTLPYLFFSMTSARRDIADYIKNRSIALLGVTLILPIMVYGMYAIGTQTLNFGAFFRLFLYVSIPTTLLLWAGPTTKTYRLAWQDFVAVICIWLPFDTGLLSEIWLWPEGEGAYVINTSLAVSLSVIWFTCWRKVPKVNFRFAWSQKDIIWAIYGFIGFSAIAIPIGFATNFLSFNPVLDLGKIVAAPLGIFFFIAVPEELLFRGLVQNLLGHFFQERWKSLLIASLFFGATHFNNEPMWDFRFFILATIAGFFYGVVYEKTRSILAPALTHAAVDVIWLLLLHT